MTTGKLYVAHWKAFRICKKNEFASITNDATLKSVCHGPPQNDPKGLIKQPYTNKTPIGGFFKITLQPGDKPKA